MPNLLQPTYAIASFGAINPETLLEKQPQVRALTHDIDGYLMDYDGLEIPEEHLEVIRGLERSGLAQAIISNAEEGPRLERSIEVARRIREQAGISDLILISSGMEGMRRKPDPSMFLEAASQLGLSPDEMCHGGDQLFKDVYGANSANYGVSILTRRFGRGDDPRVKFLQRPAEAASRLMFTDSPLRTADFDGDLR